MLVFTMKKLQVSLFPDLVQDILIIEPEQKIWFVEIFNPLGQKLLQTTGNEINVSTLTAGTYIIRIYAHDQGITAKKFFKEG